MAQVTILLPESLRRAIEVLAAKEGQSVEQFLVCAAAEKMEALRTLDYLRREATGARREDFQRFLDVVPDQPPCDSDRLPGR